jgi:phosphoribosylaminoimidazole (AIR) synthetase
MFEVFNMGIGMVLVVARHQAEEVASKTGAKVIGQVTPGSGKVLLT